jgi:hypothetical protein
MTWTIEAYSAASSTIRHGTRPRFSARWTTGELPHGLHQLAGPVWTDEGHGIEDTIHLYEFQWIDPPPDQAGFEQLMRAAVREIDQHIQSRS